MTIRPPNRSVQTPSGRRNSAPVRIGVAVSRPNSEAFRCSVLRIGMPVTPNIIQAAKQTAKARVRDQQHPQGAGAGRRGGGGHGQAPDREGA